MRFVDDEGRRVPVPPSRRRFLDRLPDHWSRPSPVFVGRAALAQLLRVEKMEFTSSSRPAERKFDQHEIVLRNIETASRFYCVMALGIEFPGIESQKEDGFSGRLPLVISYLDPFEQLQRG